MIGALALTLAACSQTASTPEETAPSLPSATARLDTQPIQARDNYYQAAAAQVDAKIKARGVRPAKNVILFVGDGMGISTITAARIHAGQTRGVDGESYRLTMETLPSMALSKTYSHDFQVSDSASTATALTSGIKTNSRTLGTQQAAPFGNSTRQQGEGTTTLIEFAERAGLATGCVSTARIPHATPAAT